jgi:hypothetical protein
MVEFNKAVRNLGVNVDSLLYAVYGIAVTDFRGITMNLS